MVQPHHGTPDGYHAYWYQLLHSAADLIKLPYIYAHVGDDRRAASSTSRQILPMERQSIAL